jgi:hypothetical protein
MITKNAKAPVKKTAAKKNAAIESVPAKIQKQIDALIAAKKAKKIAESEIKKAEPEIIEHGYKLLAKSNEFKKSVKMGNDDSNINMVTANKWSFKQDDVEDIKECLGDDADEMLPVEQEVRLKDEVFNDPKLQAAFLKMVGKNFEKFFETVETAKPSADFDKKLAAKDEDVQEDVKTLMKQYKPSLR